MAENMVNDRKFGNWFFTLYAPEGSKIPWQKGRLQITKDFHWVETKDGTCVFNVPSQNVAYVINKMDEEEEE